MRRAIVLSIFMHIALAVVLMLELPDIVMPEKEIKQVNIKLVTDPTKATKKEVKAAPPKPVASQQSAAPKYAPKKQKEQKQEVKHQTQVVKKNVEKVVKQKKEEQKKEAPKTPKKKQEEVKKQEFRPEKLDKTDNKKSVTKTEDKKVKPKDSEKIEDDFLSTLDFIDNLEIDEKPSTKTDEAEETESAVYDIDQIEIAKIQRKVKSNWFVTAGANKLEELETIVRLSLERDGTVTRVRVVKSSGQLAFDSSLQRAIRKSSPLPIPADKYEIYKTIELRFRR